MASDDTEFGGKVQRNGVQPPPHVPTANERLSLTYRTGDPSGRTDPDDGEIFAGLRTTAAQRAAMEAAGAFVKGTEADRLLAEAEAELAALEAEAAPE